MRGYEGFVPKRTISHYKPIARFAGEMEVQVVMPLRLFEIGAIGGRSPEAALAHPRSSKDGIQAD